MPLKRALSWHLVIAIIVTASALQPSNLQPFNSRSIARQNSRRSVRAATNAAPPPPQLQDTASLRGLTRSLLSRAASALCCAAFSYVPPAAAESLEPLLSAKEARSFRAEAVQEFDTDGDGAISEAEFDAVVEAQTRDPFRLSRGGGGGGSGSAAAGPVRSVQRAGKESQLTTALRALSREPRALACFENKEVEVQVRLGVRVRLG